MYLGLPSVLKDPDTKRRSLYGKAGCFRLTPYGLEYRVLSSYFLRDRATLGWVWTRLMRAIDAFNNNRPRIPSVSVEEAINNSDLELANNLIKKYRL